jgi:hypothetical protein
MNIAWHRTCMAAYPAMNIKIPNLFGLPRPLHHSPRNFPFPGILQKISTQPFNDKI